MGGASGPMTRLSFVKGGLLTIGAVSARFSRERWWVGAARGCGIALS